MSEIIESAAAAEEAVQPASGQQDDVILTVSHLKKYFPIRTGIIGRNCSICARSTTFRSRCTSATLSA